MHRGPLNPVAAFMVSHNFSKRAGIFSGLCSTHVVKLHRRFHLRVEFVCIGEYHQLFALAQCAGEFSNSGGLGLDKQNKCLSALSPVFNLSKEWDAGCRQLILDHFAWLKRASGKSCPLPCLFGDLEGCLPKGCYAKDDQFMTKLDKIDRVDFKCKQHCYAHNKACPLFGRATDSDLEVAGLPCWDISAAGKRLKENGPTASVFLAHAKRHVQKMTPLIIIENTKAGTVAYEQ